MDPPPHLSRAGSRGGEDALEEGGNPLQCSCRSRGQRSLVGCGPWDHTDTTEQLNTHTPHHTCAAKLPFSYGHEHSVLQGLEGTLGTSLSYPQENITIPPSPASIHISVTSFPPANTPNVIHSISAASCQLLLSHCLFRVSIEIS